MTASVQIAGAHSAARTERATNGVSSGAARRQESPGSSASTSDVDAAAPGHDSHATEGDSFESVLKQCSTTASKDAASTPTEDTTTDQDSFPSQPTSVGLLLLQTLKDTSKTGPVTKSTGNDKSTPPQTTEKNQAAATTIPVETQVSPREVLPFQLGIPFRHVVPVKEDTTESDSGQSDSRQEDASQSLGSKNAGLDTTAAPTPKPEASITISRKVDDLAFAARLTPDHPDTTAAPDAKTVSQAAQKQTVAAASVSEEPAPAQKKSTVELPEPVAKQAVFTPTLRQEAAYASTPAPSKTAAPDTNGMAAARVEELIEARQASAGPLHQITIRIPDATERGTDVRFIDRGGEVHVSVRTGDGETAQALRGGLSDFVNRLDHAGIRAEVWRPGSDASQNQSQQQSDSQQQSNSQQRSMHQGGSGRHHHGSGERQGQSQDGPMPEWVEQLESSIGNSAPA